MQKQRITDKMHETVNTSETRAVINSPWIYFVFVFLLVFWTDSFWTYTWENRILYTIANIAVVIVAGFCLLIIFGRGKNIALKRFAVIATIYIGIFLCLIVRSEFSLGYIHKLCYPLIGVALGLTLDFRKFAKAFVQVMIFLAVWSLVLYIMAQFKLEEKLPVVTNIGGIEFHNGIFGFIAVQGDTLVRNWGFFWEPGAFQAYLGLALIFDLFLLKDRKPIILIILSVTILTTLSTTGILSLGLILIIYLIAVKDKESNLNKRIILVVVILGIMVLLISDKLKSMVFSKFTFDDINDSASFGARYYSIVGNLKIAVKEGLFFGTGIEKYNSIYINTLLGIGYNKDMSNTNTILSDLARFGWLVGIAETIMVWKFSKKLGENTFQRLGIVIVITIMLFMENFSYSLFWMSVMCFGLEVFNGGQRNENNVSL